MADNDCIFMLLLRKYINQITLKTLSNVKDNLINQLANILYHYKKIVNL